MKKIRSYTNIWDVEKVLYAIGDFNMPFPVTFTQIAWGLCSFIVILVLQDFPPLSLIDNILIRNVALPIFIAWFMSQKAFDGKRPYKFLASVFGYIVRPKLTFAGKKVVFKKMQFHEEITAVRSERYVPD